MTKKFLAFCYVFVIFINSYYAAVYAVSAWLGANRNIISDYNYACIDLGNIRYSIDRGPLLTPDHITPNGLV
jgi:hypothetical protein